MSSMQPTTSKAAEGNKVPDPIQPKLRYECLHLKEVKQVKASLNQLKKDYGDLLIKTTSLIQKLTDLEKKVINLEAPNAKT